MTNNPQTYFSTSPRIHVAVIVDVEDKEVHTELFLGLEAAEQYILEHILEHYDEVNTDDEDSPFYDLDIEDLADVLQGDDNGDERFQLSQTFEFDLFQEIPQLAPKVNLALPDVADLP